MRPVRPGGEHVDHRGVEGIQGALLALPVAVLAAPPTEEVALGAFPVRAAAAAAFRDKCRASSATRGGPAVETSLAGVGKGPVLLDRRRPVAALERAFGGRGLADDGRRYEALGEFAAPLGNEGWKVHVGLLFRYCDAECVGA